MTEYHLINLCDGDIEASFESPEQLMDYLRRKNDDGALMGEIAYTVAKGQMLTIEQFYPKS